MSRAKLLKRGLKDKPRFVSVGQEQGGPFVKLGYDTAQGGPDADLSLAVEVEGMPQGYLTRHVFEQDPMKPTGLYRSIPSTLRQAYNMRDLLRQQLAAEGLPINQEGTGVDPSAIPDQDETAEGA